MPPAAVRGDVGALVGTHVGLEVVPGAVGADRGAGVKRQSGETAVVGDDARIDVEALKLKPAEGERHVRGPPGGWMPPAMGFGAGRT